MNNEADNNHKIIKNVQGPITFSDVVHKFIAEPPERKDEAIRELFTYSHSVFRFLSGLLAELDDHTRKMVEIGGFQPNLQIMYDKWLAVAHVLLENKFLSEAWIVGHRLYQLIRSLEIKRRDRFIKGGLLWWLGQTCLVSGKKEEAINFFLLAMIEDIRTDRRAWKSLPAYSWLVNEFQIATNIVNKIGESFETDVVRKKTWDPREPELGWLLSRPHRRRITRGHLEFIKSVADVFHARIDAPARTNKEKGDRLEQLISYLFAVELGFEVIGSTTAPDSQNDVLIRNRHHDPVIASLGDYLLVECKNWNVPVGAPRVRDFAGKLRSTKVKTGVLVSRKGVTGGNRTKRIGAWATINKEYSQDGTAVLVIKDNVIKEICEGRSKLSLELLDQFEGVRFDIQFKE